jgi:hypothetical protein
MSDNLLADMRKRGIAILQDCKTQRKEMPNRKSLPEKVAGLQQPVDIHDAAVKKFIKDKPNKKHLLEFFNKIIEIEEAKL